MQLIDVNNIVYLFIYNARSHCLKSVLYESTKHGTNGSSRHHPQKWQMNFRIFPWVLLKLSVKGLLRYYVKCFGLRRESATAGPQPSPGPAVLSSSESPHAGVLHLQNSQQVFRFHPQAMNSLFSNCHVRNVQVFMGNNSAGFH